MFQIIGIVMLFGMVFGSYILAGGKFGVIAHALTHELMAIGGAGIVLDATTGEVLALTSLPELDPNAAGRQSPEAQFNRATLGVY